MGTNAATAFDWKPQPAAQRLIDGVVERFLNACPRARDLAERMLAETGTRFVDWIDHVQLPANDPAVAELAKAGFVKNPDRTTEDGYECHLNTSGRFPAVLVGSGLLRVAIKVDSVSDFLAVWRLDRARVQGRPLSQLRTACAFDGESSEMLVVERHGTLGFGSHAIDANFAMRSMSHYERLRCRSRDDREVDKAYADLRRLVESAVAELGQDLACDLFFRTEREYWMRRNAAARFQKGRQDRLGLGWSNHDHHTYRSSRGCYKKLIRVLEALGMTCRERFYAGKEAGWGAQVLEHPVTGIVVFADVDLDPSEAGIDFAHEGLEDRPGTHALGTVGLWCALHGEAMLAAGMHHLECQFDSKAVTEQLNAAGYKTMAPFTTLPELRQSMTEGERWSVDGWRVDALLEAGRITAKQGAAFRKDGAVGSHLEILERRDGFKGFSQEGVSDIIARTDPRKLVGVE